MPEKKKDNVEEPSRPSKGPAHFHKGMTNAQRSDRVRAKLKGVDKGKPATVREGQNLQMQSIALRSEFGFRASGQANVEKKNDKKIRFHNEPGAPFPLREGRMWRPPKRL